MANKIGARNREVFNKAKGGLQLIPSRMKEQIIEHVAYKYLERNACC